MISDHKRISRSLVLFLSICVVAIAQVRPERLPQDTGEPGLNQALKKLKTTGRLMQTTAHPDDEDGALLAYMSRGRGVTTMLFTLTRGDGGQNKTGSNLFDELGVLRTLELLESDRFYGAEQRFTHVADFGFSKDPQEAFQKWGKDVVLADMVRVIREFRPDVIAAGWSGTSSDGHGHHQASGLLTPEAVRLAADPTKYPEAGPAWQVKKLYHRTRGDNYTVRVDAAQVDPNLGKSYAAFGVEGYSHQKSQNAEMFALPAGPLWRSYRMVENTVGKKYEAGEHESDFFDGIDTSLPGIASRLGDEEKKVPFLRPALVEIDKLVDEAIRTRQPEPLMTAWAKMDALRPQIMRADLSKPAKWEAMLQVETKSVQFQEASRLALGLDVSAHSDGSALIGRKSDVNVTLALKNSGSKPLQITQATIDVSPSAEFPIEVAGTALAPGTNKEFKRKITIPADAPLTRPYWRRSDPERENVFTLDPLPSYFPSGLPLPLPPVSGFVKVKLGEVERQFDFDVKGRIEGRDANLAIVPAFSLLFQYASQVVPVGTTSSIDANVVVRSNLKTPATSVVRLKLPAGWKATPSEQTINIAAGGEKVVPFKVFPDAAAETRAQITAELTNAGTTYSEGFSVVTREDIDTFYYYQPSVQKISVVKVDVPKDLTVGYVKGAGDDILPVLQQIGMNATLISPAELATGDLQKYNTIILGIRAYDANEDVRKNNARLLEYVKNGGTLIVQNNQQAQQFNEGNYTPYPAQLSRERVSVEDAPVEILEPDDALFNTPNKITNADFDGWIQERGVNFMIQWDPQYTPLLGSNDPGEKPLRGGMLRAKYGKGTYVYTGYAFFRQLPAGVPGAIRLYVNLLNLGHGQH